MSTIQIAGRSYEIVRAIAEGGHADVFEAVLRGDIERRVAIKRLSSDQEPSLQAEFEDEARLVAQLSHGSIVSLVDFGTVDDQPTLVFEFVDGIDLVDLRGLGKEQGAFLPIELCLHIVTEVAQALDYAHSAKDLVGRAMGLVHRDVTPRNVLVSWTGEVKITDFGIAWTHDRTSRTQAGMTKGTLAYMAPEQRLGQHVDRRTDVFGLGCVLHFLLTGRSPVEDLPLDRSAEPRIDPNLPEDIERIIVKATSLSPKDRYSSAAELASDTWSAANARLSEAGPLALRKFLDRLAPAGQSTARIRDRVADLAPPPERPGTVPFNAAEASAAFSEQSRATFRDAGGDPSWMEWSATGESTAPTQPGTNPAVDATGRTLEPTAVVRTKRSARANAPIGEAEVDVFGPTVVRRPSEAETRVVHPARGRALLVGFGLALALVAGLGAFATLKTEPAAPARAPQPTPEVKAKVIPPRVDPPEAEEVDPEPAPELATPPPKKARAKRVIRKKDPKTTRLSAGTLRREVEARARSKLGLSSSDLDQLPKFSTRSGALDAAIETGDASKIEEAHRALLTLLDETPVPIALLKSLLGRASDELRAGADALDKKDLQTLESDYLALRSAITPGLTDPKSRAVAIRIRNLRQRIRAAGVAPRAEP